MSVPPKVFVERTGEHVFKGTNDRGAEVTLSKPGREGAFSPGELLLVAVGACANMSAESVLARRLGETAPQSVTVEADKDQENNRYTSMRVSFDVDFSGLSSEERDAAIGAALRAIDRACTVSRTVEASAAVPIELDSDAVRENSLDGAGN